VLVGLGATERVEILRIHWLSGKVEEWKNPPIDRYMILKEGAAPESK
jgi:hypothetical protein